ncbi:MAG: hypothetical protein R3B13_25725 [Polyangiaceae bacterium]
MLERIAVHQTRLRTPGIGLDARGVAMGSRGLVLLPSLDRLVAFLSVYTEEQSLTGLSEGMDIQVVRSKLGTREVALAFDAGSSDRMDRVAEVARLTGGFTFTGTSRHFVQYRDASAPFGYDTPQVTATDSALSLYHCTFSQTYDLERHVELRALLLRLSPHPDPKQVLPTTGLWIVAERGVGAALLAYLARSGVKAMVGLAEWPPESSFDDEPVRRFLFKVVELPPRLRPLLAGTPGMAAFVEITGGAAVEHGYHHPIALEACPVFAPEGLVLFRGRGEPALELERVPALAELSSLERAELDLERAVHRATAAASPDAVRVPIRLLADPAASAAVEATLIPTAELELLRRLAYALPVDTLKATRLCLTDVGAFVLSGSGPSGIPLGHLYWRYHPQIFVPVGSRLVPAIDAAVLVQTLGLGSDELVFFNPDGSAFRVSQRGFVELEQALLEGQRWAPVRVTELDQVFAQGLPTVWLDELGLNPLDGAEGT